jgi:hypothetical protein
LSPLGAWRLRAAPSGRDRGPPRMRSISLSVAGRRSLGANRV